MLFIYQAFWSSGYMTVFVQSPEINKISALKEVSWWREIDTHTHTHTHTHTTKIICGKWTNDHMSGVL